MPGPAPTPSAIKRTRGNPGKRPLPKFEPAPKLGTPTPPKWMRFDEDALVIWRELARQLAAMGVLTKADRTALAALVEAYRDWLRARQALEDHGSEYYEKTTDRGGAAIVAHPAVQVRDSAWKRLTTQLDRFGLSPSSRTRVSVLPENSEDELGDFLRNLH